MRPADLSPHGMRRLAVPARLRALVERPPHQLRAADLSRVEQALSRGGHESAAPVTRLLHARLAYRFAGR
ncbi:hypothetical protein [Micromonospora sp. CPCC 206061]|uniref:hypothetical protein n=1 Tax=Micromonospora sp. CPCC 206061 TaxID=3122410 RepID=UPI002FF2922E